MKRKATLVVTLASALALMAGTAQAQRGPGMMQNNSQAQGQNPPSWDMPMMGWAYGPGGMGGFGPWGGGMGYGGMMMGPGMMGPGMMGGYGGMMGPGMMGPGMMGGYGGMMGPGMMGGYGGMGPGMMGYGYGPRGGIELSDKQRQRLNEIRQQQFQKMPQYAQRMHEQQQRLWDAYQGEDLDVDAVMDAQKQLSELRLQMLREHLQVQKQMRDLLTDEQREQLRQAWGGSRGGQR